MIVNLLKRARILVLASFLLTLFSSSGLLAQTPADFPFLAQTIDPSNCCKNETVTLFTTPAAQFIYIANNEECFGGGGRLFLADGTFYCEDNIVNCIEFYGLTNGQVIYECTATDFELDLFDRFSFLSGLVDVNNCNDEVIEFYRNDLGHEFVCVLRDGTRTFHYPDGSVACVSS